MSLSARNRTPTRLPIPQNVDLYVIDESSIACVLCDVTLRWILSRLYRPVDSSFSISNKVDLRGRPTFRHSA